MRVATILAALMVLAIFAGAVWLIATYPAVAIGVGILTVILLLVDWRRAVAPSPFGGYAKPEESRCGHCGRIIEHDDAVRAIPGHLPMHERCARERQAVQQ